VGRESDQGGDRGPDEDKRIKGAKALEPEWSSIHSVVAKPVELRRERIELDSRTRQDELQDELRHRTCGVQGGQVIERKSRPLRREQPLHTLPVEDDRGRTGKREPQPLKREPQPLREHPCRRREP
jgi:hypothetical protein